MFAGGQIKSARSYISAAYTSIACFECGKFPEKTKTKVNGQSNISFFKRCSGCHLAAFCSVSCQRKSWKKGHKLRCGAYKDALAEVAKYEAEMSRQADEAAAEGQSVLQLKKSSKQKKQNRHLVHLEIIHQFAPTVVNNPGDAILQMELSKVLNGRAQCAICLSRSSSNGGPLIPCDCCYWNFLCDRHVSERHGRSECVKFQDVNAAQSFQWHPSDDDGGYGYHLAPEPHQNYKRNNCPKDWDTFFDWRTLPHLQLRPECKVAGSKNLSQPLTALFAMDHFGMWKRIKEGKQRDMVMWWVPGNSRFQ
eukprot:Nk52_evm6s241 gene=Nk52_evmTU6s241